MTNALAPVAESKINNLSTEENLSPESIEQFVEDLEDIIATGEGDIEEQVAFINTLAQLQTKSAVDLIEGLSQSGELGVQLLSIDSAFDALSLGVENQTLDNSDLDRLRNIIKGQIEDKAPFEFREPFFEEVQARALARFARERGRWEERDTTTLGWICMHDYRRRYSDDVRRAA